MTAILLSRTPGWTSDSPSALIFNWADAAIPCLLDFDVIIADVPSATTRADLVAEIVTAHRAARRVAWILWPDSDIAVIAPTVTTTFFQCRESAQGNRFEIEDDRFSAYLAHVQSYSWLCSSSPEGRPIAHAGSADASVAFVQGEGAGRPVVVLPAPATLTTRVLDDLLAGVQSVSSLNLAAARKAGGLRRATAACALAVFGLVGLRYIQRHSNLSFRDGLQRDSVPLRTYDEPLLDDLSESSLAAIPGLDDPSPHSSRSASDGVALAALLGRIGLYADERRVLQSIHDTAWTASTAYTYARSHYLTYLAQHLADGEFELARYSGQRYINASNALPPTHALTADNRMMNAVNKACELIRTSYTLHDTPSIGYVAGLGTHWEGEGWIDEPSEPRSPIVDSFLQDAFAYRRVAIALSRETHPSFELEAGSWHDFIKTHPGSQWVEQATFNVLQARLRHLRGRADRRVAHTEAIADADAFAAAYPTSYLADDALAYAARLAFATGDARLGWDHLLLLHARSPSDALGRLLYDRTERLSRSRATMMLSPDDIRVFIAAALDDADKPFHSSDSADVILLGPRDAVAAALRRFRLAPPRRDETMARVAQRLLVALCGD